MMFEKRSENERDKLFCIKVKGCFSENKIEPMHLFVTMECGKLKAMRGFCALDNGSLDFQTES